MTTLGSSPSDTRGSITSAASSDRLTVTPFESLRVAFGMMLGEADFDALMGNPRGKQMLHTSWLHGSGVVWGFGAGTTDDGQLQVLPGLAVDGLGRELVLHRPWCIDVGEWLARQNLAGAVPVVSGQSCAPAAAGPIDAEVVAVLDLCAGRPVQALADPCDLQRTSTQPSRLFETARLELRQRVQPEPAARPYHRVRVLLGLDRIGAPDAAGHEAAQELAAVLGEPPGKRARLVLAAFRRMLALDVSELQPRLATGDSPPGVFPVPEEDAEVVLATVTIEPGTPPRWEVSIGSRPSLMATATIQELSCALAPGLLGGGAGADSGGPRVIRESVRWLSRSVLAFDVTKPLIGRTLRRGAVRVMSLGQDGWNPEEIDDWPSYQDGTVTIDLHDPPSHALVRLVVRGTGTFPVTGTTGIPLAGLDDGPPGSTDDGHDAVVQLERSTS